MKLTKKVMILFIILMCITISKVNAASANVSTDKSKMKVGETATVTVSYTAAAWNIQVKGAVSYSDADASSNAKNTTITKKLTFKPSKAGTYSVTLSGDITDGDTGKTTDKIGKTITIKVNESSNNNNNNNNSNNNNENNNNSKLSNDATLSNLGIKPNDFSGFRKATTSYNVSVPKSTDKISIYATTTNSKATVSGTGSKTLKMGKNTFAVKVTAEDKKTTKTYTLNITREEKEENASDATLSNLGIRPKEFDFTGFKSSKTEYSVFVPNEVEKINIYAYPTNSKATVSGNGEKSLKMGENKFEIKVTSEDKKETKTYILKVTKDEQEEHDEEDNQEETPETTNQNSNVVGITNIKIANYELSPAFNTDTFQYTVDVTDDVTDIDIDIEKSGDNIETEIAGNKNLQKGNNVITILSHNTKTDETKTYQIVAYLGNKKNDLSELNTEIDKVQKKLKIKSWIIKGIIALIILLIIVFFIKRYKLQNEDYFNEEDGEEEISETKKSYQEMENNLSKQDKTQENTSIANISSNDELFEKPKRKGKYKGKRFK